MRKIALIALAIFGATSAFAWGNPYLTPAQNMQNYKLCLNTKANGTKQQKILARWACLTYYGIDTNPEG
ncbi:hypothetical protein [Campylobacter estrildidarum]|uniref:Uncharacterized protein n=1 Tax=Campylobacter estrildidarum TaxID=2510189 RepID=A0A4U7BGQ7_9BACT|nr:hypothetical protein [Campylobacter estrildidarum]TKX30933.1 hypothetical protein CQA69_04325 [Campylobacter estrildidarum]